MLLLALKQRNPGLPSSFQLRIVGKIDELPLKWVKMAVFVGKLV
jgi:hypothetical protein